MLQNATPLRKSAPGPPNSSDEHVSCTAPATENAIFADPLQMSHACHRFWKCYKTLTFCSLLTRCTIPCACHAKRQSERPKVLRTPTVFCTFDFEMCFAPQAVHFFRSSTSKSALTWCVLYIIDLGKCASRHNGVHFFDICNFQKCSEREVLSTFCLGNVLCATTACTFSTSQLPKVVREWCVLYILISKCASRQNGVQFFISHLARWLRTAALASPSGATNHWKNAVNRHCPTFSRTCIFLLLTLSLL